MPRSFYYIMAAQFFSSLADNALFVIAFESLAAASQQGASGNWQQAALVPMFAVFYVVLAPFVGAFSDAHPKGRVMFWSNTLKVSGCFLMLFGLHPLLAYAIVGLGAAIYSPSKYGILTELLPPSLLIKANGWIEGLTITSIILGVVLGGFLLGPRAAAFLLSFDFPLIETRIDSPYESALLPLIMVYAIAAAFNFQIPRTTSALIPLSNSPLRLLVDFLSCNKKLWQDKLGQISLATTTLFWGISGNLRIIVFSWAAVALEYNTQKASLLVGVIAIGTAFGALIASSVMRLETATKTIPLGILMGALILMLNVIDNLWVALPFFILLGACGGYIVVPMNALLQHRGHNLMGAGRSIAVQNFNEQLCILLLGLFYTGMTYTGVSARGAIAIFGLVILFAMAGIGIWHKRNVKNSPDEINRLLEIARQNHL